MQTEQNMILKSQRQELTTEFEKLFHKKEFEWQREKDELDTKIRHSESE